MTTLDQLGRGCGTDKSSLDHNYTTTFYEGLLGSWRDDPVHLLELGILNGCSLRMWGHYFTHSDARIVGVDKNPVDIGVDDARIEIYCGDQAEVVPQLRATSFDIIIDDASHISSKTIASFVTWWPRLKPGGTYVVEDTSTSYHGDYEGHENPAAKITGPTIYGKTTMQWFKRLADEVNAWAYPPWYRVSDFDIASVTFRPNLIIVEKKP